MDVRLGPEASFMYAQDRLNGLRREAMWASHINAARHQQRPILQRALGHALIDLGRALAGEPAGQ